MSFGAGSDPAGENSVIGLLKRLAGFTGTTAPGASTVSAADQVSTDAFVAVAGSQIDTYGTDGRSVGYHVQNAGANSIDAKVQASIDGTAWTDITTLDELGAERAGVAFAVGAAAVILAFVTPEYDAGAKAGFRHFRVSVKATGAGLQGTARVRGFAK